MGAPPMVQPAQWIIRPCLSCKYEINFTGYLDPVSQCGCVNNSSAVDVELAAQRGLNFTILTHLARSYQFRRDWNTLWRKITTVMQLKSVKAPRYQRVNPYYSSLPCYIYLTTFQKYRLLFFPQFLLSPFLDSCLWYHS